MYLFFTHGAPRSSQKLVQKCSCMPGPNWNLEMLVFEEVPGEKPSEQRKELTNRLMTPGPGGYIGGRDALSPLHNPCSPYFHESRKAKY